MTYPHYCWWSSETVGFSISRWVCLKIGYPNSSIGSSHFSGCWCFPFSVIHNYMFHNHIVAIISIISQLHRHVCSLKHQFLHNPRWSWSTCGNPMNSLKRKTIPLNPLQILPSILFYRHVMVKTMFSWWSFPLFLGPIFRFRWSWSFQTYFL